MVFEWKESGCKIKITFSVEGHLAISLPRSPYAGFQIEGSFSPSTADRMFIALNHEFSKKNIRTVAIRQRPNFEQGSETAILHQGLLRHGFGFIKEANQHILLKEDIKQNLHSMQIRKINKCEAAKLTFKQDHAEEIQEVYAFLSKCRKQQRLAVNIEEYRLTQLFSTLPLNYECYTVRNHEGKILAATVIVLINDKIAYNYLPGFDRAYKSFSPLSYLLFNLYDQLKLRNYEIFDLGLSSLNGELQKSLYTYKKRMGAIHSDRFVYERNIKKIT